MQDSIIGERVRLQNVILDKNVKINDEKILLGESIWPVIIAKNTIV